ncbi:lamin tail domain-containing protein [Candidatus Woesearchaeota archaeon]|nr:lamin tail domain-containing protein [Candidatus Woesearchaeota archaeon]
MAKGVRLWTFSLWTRRDIKDMCVKFFFPALLFLLIITIPVSAANSVIITEVLYDPLNESGGEAVELYNPTNDAINMGGWVIATESSSTDATIPANTVLAPGSHYLIADAGWAFTNPAYLADYEEALTLANIDAGVALTNNGTVIDAVGWGNASNIGSGLFEGIPAAMASEGQSLQRASNNSGFIDANNNSADFLAGTPNLKNRSSSGSEITVFAVITGSAPVVDIINFTADDDSIAAGVQLLPIPKANRTLGVRTVVTDANGYSDVSDVALAVNSDNYAMQRISGINSTSALYEANISIPFYRAAGNYSVNVSARDSANFTSHLVSAFEVLSILSIELDTKTLAFAASPGSYAEVAGDANTSSTDRATIRNTGNTAVNLQLSGTNLTTGGSMIGVQNILYSFDGNYSSPSAGALNYSRQTRNIGLASGASSLQQLSFRLNVPVGTSPGNYTGKIFINAVS